ncbi:CHASE2 domain-containing protein [Deltaproteobacteria bacterium OttesenSCG-928-M10]|nr:CHASE2 domain-containing protein [Deltaproteobacteria bacterium OttesenSCG-928-M10]
MRRNVIHWRPKPRVKNQQMLASKTDGQLDLTKLLINMTVFAVLCLALQFAEMSRLGQETLDRGYDYLIRANFKKMVLQNGDPAPVSPDLRLVFFETRDYQQSYTKGYWTPRDEVALAVLNSLKRGARVILVDFSFAGETPVVMHGDQSLDGTKKFLELLAEAAELARDKKAAILVPVVSSSPPKGYIDILSRYRDVFRPASFVAMRDGHDGKVRRLSWFSYNNDYTPILSSSLLAALISGQKDEAAAVREAKGLLVGAQDQAKLLSPVLSRAIKPDKQKASSRIIYRLLPRAIVAREFGSGPDLSKGVVWLPQQIASNNLAEPDFTGKIVLIGSDYQENGDYHQTAFGPMAGSYILANGLNMTLTERMIEEAKGLNLTLLIVTGLLASFLYARFPSYVPTALFFGMALLSPWLSAWVFNRYGFFLDVWLPALGIGGYNLIADNVNWQLFIGRQGLLSKWLRIKKRLAIGH